jgi:hypothetical protein
VASRIENLLLASTSLAVCVGSAAYILTKSQATSITISSADYIADGSDPFKCAEDVMLAAMDPGDHLVESRAALIQKASNYLVELQAKVASDNGRLDLPGGKDPDVELDNKDLILNLASPYASNISFGSLALPNVELIFPNIKTASAHIGDMACYTTKGQLRESGTFAVLQRYALASKKIG